MNNGMLSTIGQTPLVLLKKIYQEFPFRIYGKMEMFNPGGSIKDRPAFKMIYKALEEGKLRVNDTVIESSSGNMAIGLAQVCCYFGLNLIVVVDPKINDHTLKILRAYGARIEQVTRSDGDGNYLSGRLQRVEELLHELPDCYWPNQYQNDYNPAAHYRTMEEIVQALPEPPDYLLAATSTCGTVMGCADYVREHNLNTKIVAVDAIGSVIFGTPSADRLVPGHGAGRPSDLLNKDVIDHVLHLTDEECVTGCHRLLDQEAVLAGGSSGAVVLGVEKLQPEIRDKKATLVLILPDSGERYLDTIYSDKWVCEHFSGIETPIFHKNGHSRSKIKKQTSSTISVDKQRNSTTGEDKNTRKIAIVGGGPKGMYGFERLSGQFEAFPPKIQVEIHVYNRADHFGAGDIYHPAQPPYLLTNNAVGDINIWIDEAPPPVVMSPSSLAEWLERNTESAVEEKSYVSRAVVGKYLEKGFESLAVNLPDSVKGEYLIGEVTDIQPDEDDTYKLTVKNREGTLEKIPHRYHHILLATGHQQNHPTDREQEFQQFADSNEHFSFVPFIYPVEVALKELSPGCHVAIKGMGLTFVDAVLALTEGRGGRFKRNANNDKLVYHSSGEEPAAIYPFSRSGMPMIPRRPVTQADELPLKFFTRASLNELKKNAPEGKLDFKEDILPLLKQEMIYAFYKIHMKERAFREDLSDCVTFTDVSYCVEEFHDQYPAARRFDPDLFLEPLKNKQVDNGEDFNEYIQSYLSFFLSEAKKGEIKSPWAAVTGVWRKATPVFGSFYAFGGFTPDSQRHFDKEVRRLLNRVTFGPPAGSVEKLLALMEKGILHFGMARKPSIMMDKNKGTFVLHSSSNGDRQPVDALIDARISKNAIRDDQSPLYRNLLDRGLIKMFENKLGSNSYKPGSVAISPEGFVLDRDGNRSTSIAVTGTPTEGITFDNDALSRTRNNFVSEWAVFIRRIYANPKIDHHIYG